jgi:glyceraldehyde-3-phosphate dehydrogenase/erythrose-4-phosphate dehydrogenase
VTSSGGSASCWYDNEWGYTCRLADLTAIVALSAKLP